MALDEMTVLIRNKERKDIVANLKKNLKKAYAYGNGNYVMAIEHIISHIEKMDFDKEEKKK
jgi:hypothetical protein